MVKLAPFSRRPPPEQSTTMSAGLLLACALGLAARRPPAQPDPPAVLLVSFGRSGSSFVSSLLASHPAARLAPGEPFNQYQPAAKLLLPASECGPHTTFCRALAASEQTNASAHQRVSTFFDALASSRKGCAGKKRPAPRAVGFKVLYSQLLTHTPRNPCAEPTQLAPDNTPYSRDGCPAGPFSGRLMADAQELPSPIADVTAQRGAKAIHLIRENRLAHYLALQHATIINRAGLPLHCAAGRACHTPTSAVHVRVSRNASSWPAFPFQLFAAAEPPRCDPCDDLPLAASADGKLRFYSYPWSATSPPSRLHCASLHDFIKIVIREDEVVSAALRLRGMSVLPVTYESFLQGPTHSAGGRSAAICTLLSFLDLPCRDTKGRLLVRSTTRRMHTQAASEAISNFAEVADYLTRRHMAWMLDL